MCCDRHLLRLIALGNPAESALSGPAVPEEAPLASQNADSACQFQLISAYGPESAFCDACPALSTEFLTRFEGHFSRSTSPVTFQTCSVWKVMTSVPYETCTLLAECN